MINGIFDDMFKDDRINYKLSKINAGGGGDSGGSSGGADSNAGRGPSTGNYGGGTVGGSGGGWGDIGGLGPGVTGGSASEIGGLGDAAQGGFGGLGAGADALGGGGTPADAPAPEPGIQGWGDIAGVPGITGGSAAEIGGLGEAARGGAGGLGAGGEGTSVAEAFDLMGPYAGVPSVVSAEDPAYSPAEAGVMNATFRSHTALSNEERAAARSEARKAAAEMPMGDLAKYNYMVNTLPMSENPLAFGLADVALTALGLPATKAMAGFASGLQAAFGTPAGMAMDAPTQAESQMAEPSGGSDNRRPGTAPVYREPTIPTTDTPSIGADTDIDTSMDDWYTNLLADKRKGVTFTSLRSGIMGTPDVYTPYLF